MTEMGRNREPSLCSFITIHSTIASTLLHFAPDWLQGYPGNLHVTVQYELLAYGAELRVVIRATTDKPTPGESHCHGVDAVMPWSSLSGTEKTQGRHKHHS